MTQVKLTRILITVGIVSGIVITKTGSTQAIHYSFDSKFSAAWFSNWLATNFILLCFPCYLAIHMIFKLKPHETSLLKKDIKDMFLNKDGVFSFLRAILIILLFTFLWTGANYSYVKSLEYNKPFDTLILFSTCSGFIFLLSLFILKEKFYFTKLAAVIIAFSGVGMFSIAVGFETTSHIGIPLAVVAALFASIYKVLFQKLIKPGLIVQVTFILSSVALMNLCLLGVGIIILHFTGFEPLPNNINNIPWGLLSARGFAGLLYNFFENFGVAFCGALTVTTGSLIAIPINAMIDALVNKEIFSTYKLIGSLFLFVSFMMIMLPNQILDKYEVCCCKKKEPNKNSQSSVEVLG